jgi:hypothetical protein
MRQLDRNLEQIDAIGLIGFHKISRNSNPCNAYDETCRSTRGRFLGIPEEVCKK